MAGRTGLERNASASTDFQSVVLGEPLKHWPGIYPQTVSSHSFVTESVWTNLRECTATDAKVVLQSIAAGQLSI